MRSNISKLAARVKDNPGDSFSKFALALELLKQDDVNKARTLFESIIKEDPGYVGVYYHLGKLYSRLDENILALETYKNGIEVAERNKELHAKSELQAAILALELEIED